MDVRTGTRLRARVSCWLCCATLLLGLAQGAQAASRDGEPLVAANEVQHILAEGSALESRGLWSDALVLYQDALKATPGDRQLIQRRSMARLHYDLGRRQSDSSFLAQVDTTGATAVQNLYAEILLKIQAYYVEEPDWNAIARFGLTSLKLALHSPEFQQRYLPGVPAERIDAAFSALTESLNRYVVRQSSDAIWVAGHCAEKLQAALNLNPSATVFEFVCGAVSALDPYSAYMSDHQYGETMSQIEGNFVGLGVELKTHGDCLEIVSVIPGGPAEVAGIAAGDRIVAVDGRSVTETGGERAADLLRGPEGSALNVALRRTAGDQQLSLIRRRVEIPSVEGVRMADAASGTGYIKITSFQKTTPRDFDSALWELQRAGMRSLIVDLRGNPGGLLTAAVEIADRFVNAGVIVSTRGRNPLEDFTHRAEVAGTWNVPLVVLIDHDSASASEILAAAIHDHRRGQIVGQQSYGKGSVQGIFPLNVSSGGIRLTTARFYSPHGSVINEVGVRPDIEVQQLAKPALDAGASLPNTADDVLQTALGLSRQTPQLSANMAGSR